MFKKLNKKTLFFLSFFLFIGVIYFFSLQSKNSNQTNPVSHTEIKPVILDPNQKINPGLDLTGVKLNNITPSNEGSYALVNNQVSLVKEDKVVEVIDVNNENVTNFTLNQNSLAITTGNLYGSNQKFYIYNIKEKTLFLISTSQMGHIVSTSGSPDGKKAIILGSYNNKTDTSNVYLYDTTTKKSSLINSNLPKNEVIFIENDKALLISNKHRPEPNTIIDIYNPTNNTFLKKEIKTSSNKYCYKSGQLYYYNHDTKNLINYNILNNSTTNLNKTPLTEAEKLYCTDKGFHVLSSDEEQLTIKNLNKDFKLTDLKTFKTGNENIYIQSYSDDQKLTIKFYNKTKDEYFFLTYP